MYEVLSNLVQGLWRNGFGQTDGRKEEQTDGRTEGRIDGQTDGRTEGQTKWRLNARSLGSIKLWSNKYMA